jgi:predicted DNA-binding protein YlxM (UPF0122 family)
MGIKEDAEELHQMILSGRAMDAFEKFYADDVTMQENSEEMRVGKDANREFEKKFMEMVEEFHEIKLNKYAIADDVVFAYWDMDVTMKGKPRRKSSQVSIQKWNDGKIIKERFFYNPN